MIPILRHAMLAAAATLSCACGPRRAPSCSADETQGRAAEITLDIIAERRGYRAVPGDDRLMISNTGVIDTISHAGRFASWKASDRELVAQLEAVRTVDRNPRVGSWSCAADVKVLDLRGISPSVTIPIRYTSEVLDNGQWYVHVSFRGEDIHN